MKVRSRKELCLTGLKYSPRMQEYQARTYSLLTEEGDLKYNLLYSFANEGRIKSDGRLALLFRTLVMEIRLREKENEELKAKNEALEKRVMGLEEENETLGKRLQSEKRRIGVRDEIIGDHIARVCRMYSDPLSDKDGEDDGLDENGMVPDYNGA